MEIVEKIENIRTCLTDKQDVGLVPTMGYLHEGHLALVRKALEDSKVVVVSIFVNPTQFGPDEDYEEYPRDLERDGDILAEMGVDYIFAPGVDEMYSGDHCSFVEVEKITNHLCGASRPGHFRGVTTVVSKLFNIIQPDKAYFGQKDFQQYVVIRSMIKDLNFPLEIVRVPIVREEDGLALSSRNKYLSPAERRSAAALYRALQRGRELIERGELRADKVQEEMKRIIEREEPARIDYVEVVNPETLESVTRIADKVLLALAVFMGETRLIDNMYLDL